MLRSSRSSRSTRLQRVIAAGLMASVPIAPLTWTLASSAATKKSLTPLTIMQVRSTSDIYVLATTGCAEPSCLRLLRTSIDATSFFTLTLPPVQKSSGTLTDTVDSMVFSNVNDGYAILGATGPTTLYVTLNGARTWRSVVVQKGSRTLGLTATASELYAITGVCSPSGSTCHSYRVARSPLSANRWTSSPLPLGHYGKNGVWGFPYVPAAFGHEVWISEQPPGPAVIFYSRDGGTSFQKITAAKLGSVNACGLTPVSTSTLWAQCPTGMQESFFFSANAGSSWTAVPQRPFFGTGGGFFDPVSASLAYLDYGATRPLVRITSSPLKATTVGVLSCSKVNSSVDGLVFTNVNDGIALCAPGDAQATSRLETTTNGGTTWRDVLMPQR